LQLSNYPQHLFVYGDIRKGIGCFLIFIIDFSLLFLKNAVAQHLQEGLHQSQSETTRLLLIFLTAFTGNILYVVLS